MYEKGKTLANLHKALKHADGHKESVAVIYCDATSYQTCYCGDWRLTGQAVATLLGKVAEQTQTPAEFALVQAILTGVAATDKRFNGEVIKLIQDMQKSMDENGNVMPPEPKAQA